ncbi:putative baseplate assembly protein [Kitasatospora azatica]|uniref:putative baseplate assembly protein n=1 Tax=Kitasatospora azatica TaxID=58347 RepID=UPI00055F3892|nr:putative baseplate assembly protein [Kitasatospora azatica]
MTLDSTRGRINPPNLDDRTWQDLVDELRALIPTYAPAWTDQNPSDLGTTLLELFAWLVEGTIYRLNRVPEKNYLAFLNLLGVTRAPATPAASQLTFTSGAGPVLVPTGTQAHSQADDGRRPVVFETDEDVTVLPVNLRSAVLVGPYPAGAGSARYTDLTATLVGPPAEKHLLELAPGQSAELCLGFDQPTTAELQLKLRLYLPVRDPAAVTAAWVYSQGGVEPENWPAVSLLGDATSGLTRDGGVRFTVPSDWAAQQPSPKPGGAGGTGWTTVTPQDPGAPVTDARAWVAVRLTNTSASATAVGFDRVLFNSASAHSALSIRVPEELGTSTGAPFQTFALQHRPLYRRPDLTAPYADLALEVGTGSPTSWQPWTQADTLPPGPGQVYRLDPVTGEISFGDYDPQSTRGNGAVPPAGARIRAARYRYVDAGAGGNVAPGRITGVGTTPAGALPAGITAVTNLGSGFDGTDEEPIEDTLRRAPESLKIRDRAVTADDYEYLAVEASADVKTSRCLTPRLQSAIGPTPPGGSAPAWNVGDPWAFGGIDRSPGSVNVVIVPDQGASVPRPTPTREVLDAVRGHLDQRRDVTCALTVLEPRYLPIIAEVDLVIWQHAINAGADPDAIVADTRARVVAFLHPTRGGPDGTGWQVGQAVYTSDLFQAVMPSQDLGYIAGLTVKADIPLYHFPPLNPAGTAANFNDLLERPFHLESAGASVRLADYELVCSADPAKHVIGKTVPPV